MGIAKSQVAIIIEQKGFKCTNISEYKTLDTPLNIICPNGHEMQIPLRTIRDDRFKCLMCEGKNSLGTYMFSKEPPAKNGKRIVSIDNATKHAGVAVFDNGKLVHYELANFEGETIDRLIANRDYINYTIIKKWKPDLVVLEDIQLQDNVQTFKYLAMLRGSTEIVLRENGINYEIVSSAKWRSHFMISGKRVAEKAQAIDKVMSMYNVVVTDDIAEAILIGKYAVDAIGTVKPIKLF